MEIIAGRDEQVGRFRVRRSLPTRGRRTVGAWCFADHMGPAEVTEEHGLDVGPHPHIGLQTVTWLRAGEVLHRDSLGSEQRIAPGQLNLMTAGRGVAHAEERTGTYRGPVHGIQLWVAQPEATRHGDPAFEHHAELPQAELDGAIATVLVGELAGATSPARADTPIVGAELALHAATTVPLRPGFEHGLVVLEGSVLVDGVSLEPGALGFLGSGRAELALQPQASAAVMLLGGEPFGEKLLMWWNFVARTRDEIDAAHGSWVQDDGRFGTVASTLPRIEGRPPFWQQPAP
jgi:redox-sensitive bicupin YhaK (pirin superfamily)